MKFQEFISDFIPEEQLVLYDHGRFEEIIQPLADLGYLSISEEKGEIVTDEALNLAIAKFRKDHLLLDLLYDADYQDSVGTEREGDRHNLVSAQELKLLHQLVGLEGDLEMDYEPLLGDLNLYTRVTHYRLSILGLLKGNVGEAISDETLKVLTELKSWLGLDAFSNQSMIDLMGDVSLLTASLLNSQKFRETVPYFWLTTSNFTDKQKAEYKVYEDKCEIGNRFKKSLKNDFGQNSKGYIEFRKKVYRKNPDTKYMDRLTYDKFNNFILRLIQVRLWMFGSYTGTLDNSIGKMSFEAFLELENTEQALDTDGNNFKLKEFIAYVDEQYWIVNSRYFFNHFIQHIDKHKGRIDNLLVKYEQLKGDKDFEEVEQKAWRDINIKASENLKSSTKFGRRVYFGVKSIIKSIGNKIKQFFNFLMKTAKKIFNIFKNIIKVLYREIREGIRSYIQGMAFLFGKRKIETYSTEKPEEISVISDFDFDCDCVSINLINDKAACKIHSKRIMDYSKSLLFCLTLTGRAIHWIIAFSTGAGWSKLLIVIAKIFKRIIKDKLLTRRDGFKLEMTY